MFIGTLMPISDAAYLLFATARMDLPIFVFCKNRVSATVMMVHTMMMTTRDLLITTFPRLKVPFRKSSRPKGMGPQISRTPSVMMRPMMTVPMVANRFVECLLNGLNTISATTTPNRNMVTIEKKMASGTGRPSPNT